VDPSSHPTRPNSVASRCAAASAKAGWVPCISGRYRRAVKGAIYDFQRKFREDPDADGLQLKQLAGDSRLYAAGVTDA
jgi:hypothetical protein